jgi:hypothetical protein
MCCGRVGHRNRVLAYRSHRPCCPTPSAPCGCPTRRSQIAIQIAIEPAAPPDVSLPAIAARPLVNTAFGAVRLGSMSVPGPSLQKRDVRATSGLLLIATRRDVVGCLKRAVTGSQLIYRSRRRCILSRQSISAFVSRRPARFSSSSSRNIAPITIRSHF